jgi:hypothetical protein
MYLGEVSPEEVSTAVKEQEGPGSGQGLGRGTEYVGEGNDTRRSYIEAKVCVFSTCVDLNLLTPYLRMSMKK